MLERIHVYPLNDLFEHEEGESCICQPKIEHVSIECCVVIHNSFDGREGLELANEILKNDTRKPY